jgi:hypothetical protein
VWIGNFGDGAINVFDSSGSSLGQPTGKNGKPLNVDGLWSLVFGNGAMATKTPANTLFFTAGPKAETQGIFGKFVAATTKRKSGTVMSGGM